VSEPIRLIGGKKGRKRSLLVDARGVPLSLVASGANRHDVKLLPNTLDAIVVRRPDTVQPHLCADAGYKGQAAHDAIVARGYLPHVKQRREEAADLAAQRHPARRWVVERTHSWFNRFRKLLVSFEKTELSYVGLLSLAAALICWRQSIAIYG
jgi:transposase